MAYRIYSSYLSDSAAEALICDEAFIQKMLLVEVALAKVQAKIGVIPAAAASEIEAKLQHFAPTPGELTTGTLANGIPTISLLALAKKQLSNTTADYLHYGATSQDIIDTAHVLQMRDIIAVLQKRLTEITTVLADKAKAHERTYMVARTRTQQAVPTSFGLKVHGWAAPLHRHLQRLEELKPRLLKVQFGGAGGNLAALGEDGYQIAQDLAAALQLSHSGVWHSQRDSVAEFANWLGLVSGSLGKMAQDILLLTQTEIGELIENGKGSGKSSTMPHKNNPVLSESIVALSRYVGQLAGNMQAAMLHNHERDAAAWILEWLSLPQMMIATATALNHTKVIAKNMKVCEAAMTKNLQQLNGLVHSEQATFILSKHLSKSVAKQKIGLACKMAHDEQIHFAEALEKIFPDMGINWKETLQAKNYQGSTAQILTDNE